MSRRRSLIHLLCATGWCIAMVACGGRGEDNDESNNMPAVPEAVEPPDVAERPLPGQGGPGDEAFEVPDFSQVDASETEDPDKEPARPEEVACCMITFAVSDVDGEQNESYARLMGFGQGANAQGWDLTFSDGIWSVDACVNPQYMGTYFYEFGTMTQGGEIFEHTAVNPFVEQVYEQGALVNLWVTSPTCDSLDVAIHSMVEEEEDGE